MSMCSGGMNVAACRVGLGRVRLTRPAREARPGPRLRLAGLAPFPLGTDIARYVQQAAPGTTGRSLRPSRSGHRGGRRPSSALA